MARGESLYGVTVYGHLEEGGQTGEYPIVAFQPLYVETGGATGDRIRQYILGEEGFPDCAGYTVEPMSKTQLRVLQLDRFWQRLTDEAVAGMMLLDDRQQ